MERIRKAFTWARSRQGLHDIGAALGTLTAIYASLHKAGVL